MINDTWQQCIAVSFRCGGTNLLLSAFRKNFDIAQHLAKLWGNLEVDCLKRPVHWGTVLLKDEELA